MMHVQCDTAAHGKCYALQQNTLQLKQCDRHAWAAYTASAGCLVLNQCSHAGAVSYDSAPNKTAARQLHIAIRWSRVSFEGSPASRLLQTVAVPCCLALRLQLPFLHVPFHQYHLPTAVLTCSCLTQRCLCLLLDVGHQTLHVFLLVC
jgi:hypothetical protein